jgi:hypothetical protein
MNIPVLGFIAKDNELHHYFPRTIVSVPYIYSCTVTLPLALMTILTIYLFSPKFFKDNKYFIGVVVVLGTLSNILHKFNHMRSCECPTVIRALYKMGVLVGDVHHKSHHEDPTTKYGVVLPVTNYALDSIGFWRMLEALIHAFTGLEPSHKLAYTPYVEAVGKTQNHIGANLACPPVASKGELNMLREKLSAHYACPMTQ